MGDEEKDLSKDFSDLLGRASKVDRRREERRSRVKSLQPAAKTCPAIMGDKEKELTKDFSDLLGRASRVDRRREERRSRVKSLASGLETPSPSNALGAKGRNASVRNLAKRFEGEGSISSLGTETTASTTTTTADVDSRGEKKKTISEGNLKQSPQPSAKVLMAQAAFSGTPIITEKLPSKRTSTVATGSSSGTPTIAAKLPPKRTSAAAVRFSSGIPTVASKHHKKRASTAAVGLSDDKKKTTNEGNSKTSPQSSSKVLMAQAAFSKKPTIAEKLPPKRTSAVVSAASAITENLPQKRRSSVAERASMFATLSSNSLDASFSSTSSTAKTAGAPVPSEKMKRVQAAFSGPPPNAQVLPEKRNSTTSASPLKSAKQDVAESSQFFKLAQAAFSGFSGTPDLKPQSPPPRNKQQTPPPTRKVKPSTAPSPKMHLAQESQNGLTPRHTSAVPTKAPLSNPGFFAAWSNINALTQAPSQKPVAQNFAPKRTPATPTRASDPGFFAAWSNMKNGSTQPPSHNPTPPPSFGVGKSPSLAISSPPSASQTAQHAPVHQPFVALSTSSPLPQEEEKSILLSPEQQEAYKKKSRILKDPSASTAEKLRMYLTSVQQESEQEKTGLDAEVHSNNVPFSYSGKKTPGQHDAHHRGVAASQASTGGHHHHPMEITDDSQGSQGSASESSDSSPSFSDMVSKSIDKVVWNYSGGYSDNPEPAVETTLASNKRSEFFDVDISKDGVDEFDFVEDDDDMFHDEYGVITYEKQRQRKLRIMFWICVCIGTGIVASSALFGLREFWLPDDDDDDSSKKVPTKSWTGACFGNKIELRMAIDRYLQDRSSTSELAEKYGWPINSWCVSEIDDFSYLFRAKVGDGGSPVRLSSFNEDISSWDVSNGRFFNEMFLGANFNGDLSRWNVGNATNMERMFDDSSFTGDLSSWDVKNVKNTKFMFRNARNFNSDLSKWQLAPETMEGMFHNAEAFSSDLNGFDVSKVRDFADVFSGASSFNGDISTWNMDSAERLDNLFKNAELFNGDLSKWSVQPTSMDSTFYGTSSFTGRQGLQRWDTSQVDDMHRVFAHSKFQGDISSWNMASVTTTKEMFLDCQSFDGDLSKWDVSNVKDFSSMFDGAEAFSSDLSKWDVSSGTKFNRMFAGASSFNKGLSMWNIASVQSMTDMFVNATSYSKDLCTWGIQVMQAVEEPDDLDASEWTLFEGTRCPEKNSLPDFSGTPPGPFCHPCGQ